MVRSERILLKFLVLWVVIVVEFIIKFFRDYKHNIATMPEKFKSRSFFLNTTNMQIFVNRTSKRQSYDE